MFVQCCRKRPGHYSYVALLELFVFHIGEEYLGYELAKQSRPSLIRGAIRRKTNNALGAFLMSLADVHVKLIQHAKCVRDADHLLRVVHRPYLQVYEPYTVHHYGAKSLVVGSV